MNFELVRTDVTHNYWYVWDYTRRLPFVGSIYAPLHMDPADVYEDASA